jgi:hypothetical protein
VEGVLVRSMQLPCLSNMSDVSDVQGKLSMTLPVVWIGPLLAHTLAESLSAHACQPAT